MTEPDHVKYVEEKPVSTEELLEARSFENLKNHARGSNPQQLSLFIPLVARGLKPGGLHCFDRVVGNVIDVAGENSPVYGWDESVSYGD